MNIEVELVNKTTEIISKVESAGYHHTVNILINGKNVKAILDCGAVRSLISEKSVNNCNLNSYT